MSKTRAQLEQELTEVLEENALLADKLDAVADLVATDEDGDGDEDVDEDDGDDEDE